MRFTRNDLEPRRHADVEQHARRLLVNSNGLGKFPTPVRKIIEAAGVEVDDSIAFNDETPGSIRQRGDEAGREAKLAPGTLFGVLDAKERVAYIDKKIHKAKKPFVMLHETGHDHLPWQRDIFRWLEESDFTLDRSVKDQFEEEANSFASAVMFQCETFHELADKMPFGIEVPLKLSKTFGGSFYAALWRYVSASELPCGALVVEKAEVINGLPAFPVRRTPCSRSFVTQFGHIDFPDHIGEDHPIAPAIPIPPRKMIKDHVFSLTDSKGKTRSIHCESFTNGYQSFVLILGI